MLVKINSVEVDVAVDSLSIDDAIGERSTASFVVIDKIGQSHYNMGQPVEVYDNNDNLIYAGVIDKPVEKKLSITGLMHSISCKDWHYLADKRIIAAAYQNMYAGDIIKNIIDNILSQEGIIYQPGIDKAKWIEFQGRTWLGMEG